MKYFCIYVLSGGSCRKKKKAVFLYLSANLTCQCAHRAIQLRRRGAFTCSYVRLLSAAPHKDEADVRNTYRKTTLGSFNAESQDRLCWKTLIFRQSFQVLHVVLCSWTRTAFLPLCVCVCVCVCGEIDRKQNIMWCEHWYENAQLRRNEITEKQETLTKPN